MREWVRWIAETCVSTFDTDYIFVKTDVLEASLEAWRGLGHEIVVSCFAPG